LGDGCLSQYTSKFGKVYKVIVITCSLNDDLLFFQEVLIPLLNRIRLKENRFKIRNHYGSIECQFMDTPLFKFINSIGFPIGKKGTEIIISKVFYDLDLMKYIVQGFMATDGSLVLTKNPNKYYPRIEASAICKIALRQIYDYMISRGMTGAFYLSKSKPNPRWKTSQL